MAQSQINNQENGTTTLESLKLLGAGIVSLFFIFILTYTVYKMFSYIENGYIIDNNQVKVDVFTRSKDIFMTMFPLFLSLAGFWLGFKAQEKHIEKLNENVEKSNLERQQVADKNIKIEKKLVKAGELVAILGKLDKSEQKIKTNQRSIINKLPNNIMPTPQKSNFIDNPYDQLMTQHIEKLKAILSA